WLPNIQQDPAPHDGPIQHDRQNKHYFSPNQIYCIETLCAPYDTVITKFARSESPTKTIKFLNNVYPAKESQSAYVYIKKACTVLKHIVTRGVYKDWFQTSLFFVDLYHYINHKATDNIYHTRCSSTPSDGSTPNLVITATDKNGKSCFQCAFNTQINIFISLISFLLKY
ncbi:LOW QUALITY PROTEIN: hypothetical protein CVT25_012514, partial [Psilocybe cyanescens]